MYKKFDSDDFNTENQLHFGRPKVINDEQLKKYISKNYALTSRRMSVKFNRALAKNHKLFLQL